MNAAPLPAAAASLSPSLQSTDDGADRQLLDELANILKEREDIMARAERACSPEFADLTDTVRKRLQSAADLRDYQLANLRADFDVEREQAWNEFQRGKKELRNDILNVAVDRRRRIDTVRASGKSFASPLTRRISFTYPQC